MSAESKFALEAVARKVAIPEPSPEIPVLTGNPVAFASTPLAGVPRAGVMNVGDVLKTNTPVPLSSLITEASCAEVVAAN